MQRILLQKRGKYMKTVRVVAAVIKTVNDKKEPIILQPSEDMENSKMAGNFQAENRSRRNTTGSVKT